MKKVSDCIHEAKETLEAEIKRLEQEKLEKKRKKEEEERRRVEQRSLELRKKEEELEKIVIILHRRLPPTFIGILIWGAIGMLIGDAIESLPIPVSTTIIGTLIGTIVGGIFGWLDS